MKEFHFRNKTAKRLLCLLLCVAITVTGIPISIKAASSQEQTKFIKAVPEVFTPSEGEKTKITFNLEKTQHVDIYIKDGKKIKVELIDKSEVIFCGTPEEYEKYIRTQFINE